MTLKLLTSSEAVLGSVGSLDAEREEVARVMLAGLDQSFDNCLLPISSVDVDVLGRPGSVCPAQIKRKAPFK